VREQVESIEMPVSTVESLGRELELLRLERNELATELHMARAWIRELAAELQRADPPRWPEGQRG
jgi:hypothetical protein